MDDNELISVCNNLKQLQKVMIEINDVVEGMTDTNLKEKMSKMSYLESAQMHLVMAEISINMFYGLFL
jgi:singapore isolate B (sub-type 7) whole genome shotgun sequence assembly, scaffold_0